MPGARETILCGAGVIFILRPVSSITVRAQDMLTKKTVKKTVKKNVKVILIFVNCLRIIYFDFVDL
jgi:hypothetical protein